MIITPIISKHLIRLLELPLGLLLTDGHSTPTALIIQMQARTKGNYKGLHDGIMAHLKHPSHDVAGLLAAPFLGGRPPQTAGRRKARIRGAGPACQG